MEMWEFLQEAKGFLEALPPVIAAAFFVVYLVLVLVRSLRNEFGKKGDEVK